MKNNRPLVLMNKTLQKRAIHNNRYATYNNSNNSSKKNINNNYKINIIRHSGKDENLININNPNSLFLDTQTPNRKKSSLQVKMESAFCTKKYKNENGTSGAKILKEFHKSKSLKFAIAKDSESNL